MSSATLPTLDDHASDTQVIEQPEHQDDHASDTQVVEQPEHQDDHASDTQVIEQSEQDPHKWLPQQPGEVRSPCPALNTLANHSYL